MSNENNKDQKLHDEDEVQKVNTEGVPKNPFNNNDQSAGNKDTAEDDAAAEQQRKEAMTERD